MTLQLRLKEFTYNKQLSFTQYFYLDIIDTKNNHIISQRKLYPKIDNQQFRNSYIHIKFDPNIQINALSEIVLFRVVYVQKPQKIDLENMSQKIFGQELIQGKKMLQFYQKKKNLKYQKRRQSFNNQSNIQVSSPVLYQLIIQNKNKQTKSFQSNIRGKQDFCTIKFDLNYNKKKDLIGRSMFPIVPNLNQVAKICSVIDPDGFRSKNPQNFQNIQEQINSQMLKHTTEYDVRKSFIGMIQAKSKHFFKKNQNTQIAHQANDNIKKNFQLGINSQIKNNNQNFIKEQHNVGLINQNVNYEEADARQILKMYKGPCPSVNLFSVLDTRVEGQNRFNFMQRRYRDKNSKINRKKVKNQEKQQKSSNINPNQNLNQYSNSNYKMNIDRQNIEKSLQRERQNQRKNEYYQPLQKQQRSSFVIQNKKKDNYYSPNSNKRQSFDDQTTIRQ